jgi:type II secretory pathway pseudopilin PulG
MASKDKSVSTWSIRTWIALGVFLVTSIITYSLETEAFALVTVLSVIAFLFSGVVEFIQRTKVMKELMEREQQADDLAEEERLAKIKATMTPAEWEAYKLQLENNKLLKDIKRRGSQKNTTTTTYGFVDGG